jgi:two-component system phosphate regulon response regulator PhoB
MTLASIFVVDPDKAARASMADGLRELGHDVSESDSAGSALAAVRRERPDLMVCNYELPDLAGVELLTDLRRDTALKSIRVVITARGRGSAEVVAALESGADDFVGKPLDMTEFLARVAACLRRPANLHTSSVVSAGGIRIDNVGRRVSVDDRYVALAPREYRLLLFLLTNQDRVFSRDQLLIHVWDRDVSVGQRTVDVHVRRLRSILEPFEKDQFLQTVRGSGYRFSLSV